MKAAGFVHRFTAKSEQRLFSVTICQAVSGNSPADWLSRQIQRHGIFHYSSTATEQSNASFVIILSLLCVAAHRLFSISTTSRFVEKKIHSKSSRHLGKHTLEVRALNESDWVVGSMLRLWIRHTSQYVNLLKILINNPKVPGKSSFTDFDLSQNKAKQNERGKMKPLSQSQRKNHIPSAAIWHAADHSS